VRRPAVSAAGDAARKRARRSPPRSGTVGFVVASDVFAAVQEHFGVRRSDLIAKNADRSLAYERAILMFLLRKLVSLSYGKIGQLVGRRHHTTIMHFVEQIEYMVAAADVKTEKDLREIASKLACGVETVTLVYVPREMPARYREMPRA
jgi:hypothetical protein